MTYAVAKEMYMNGKSLRQIEKDIGFNRKKLSYLLKQDGCLLFSIYTKTLLFT